MLYAIDNPPTATNSAILLHPNDSVAIARVPLQAGQSIQLPSALTVQNDIPAGHKIALRAIAQDQPVYRYGNVIGFATTAIKAGQHVHTHNLSYQELDTLQVDIQSRPAMQTKRSTRTFNGFKRPDGRVGTRNYLAVVAASNCAAFTSNLIADSFRDQPLPQDVDGIVAFPHGDGCGQSIGQDTRQLQRTLEGVLDHPNIAAAIILGLGCEVNQVDHYLGKSNERLYGLTLQESGGTRATVDVARTQMKRFIELAAATTRTEVPASRIQLGLNCGGSDSFSGITANPALGHCCDLLVDQGATVALAETTEIFGAEHLLLQRARNRDVADKLIRCVENYKAYLRQFGGSFNDNPSPGNKEGGLTNILEKSLGAVAKAGTSVLEDVYEYSERIHSPGFVFMNTPGYDPVSLAGLAAGGVNLIAFTTGRGSAIGFPSIPVLKISSNSNTYRRMSGNMDINAGRIADGSATVEQVGNEIFESLLHVASGERTLAETLGHHEFVPWRIGPFL